jgi:hypothetical protein
MMVHAYNLGIQKAKQEDHEFMASFFYIVNYRPAWSIYETLSLKMKNK